jgi:hypothetical protein
LVLGDSHLSLSFRGACSSIAHHHQTEKVVAAIGGMDPDCHLADRHNPWMIFLQV